MCGLAGVTSGNAATVTAMLERIKHRGPDGDGVFASGNVIHGHVRLALNDLSAASLQPFRKGGSVLTFNGEVWNFRELRSMLEAEGVTFATTGDTEVLIEMLNCRGLDCLPQIDGMFAFAWSSPDGQHWLVRDSFGKVPIYIARNGDEFMWASERKAFPKSVVPRSVPAGFMVNLETGEFRRWYQAREQGPLDEARLLGLLRDGVRKRLAADAPVCCLISGGLDSSLILALAKELRDDVVAFTATCDPDTDDAKSARKLCAELGVRLIEVPVEVSDTAIRDAIRAIEIASKAQIEIATLCVPLAKRIYAEGFRACLSGEAADEIFGGYGNFCIKASRANDEEIVELRHQQIDKMARGNFVRCNKAFMAHGVECRLPFMEQDLIEAAIRLGKKESPPGKILLKRAAFTVLPTWIIKRIKQTFQGGSGLSDVTEQMYFAPQKFYNSEVRKQFGYLPED
jgi:asparagine synthase (glutamine-hydrolysing)